MAQPIAEIVRSLERIGKEMSYVRETQAARRAAQSAPEPEPAPRPVTIERPAVSGAKRG